MRANSFGLIPPDVVVVPLASRRLTDAIRQIVEGLWLAGKVAAIEPVFDAIVARENDGSTAFAPGLAAPHARLPEMEGIAFGIGVAPCGIDGGTRLVLLSASGLSSPNEYLRLLSGIGRLAENGPLLDRLMSAHTPEEAAACFPSATGRYRNGFASLCSPLVPSLVYQLV